MHKEESIFRMVRSCDYIRIASTRLKSWDDPRQEHQNLVHLHPTAMNARRKNKSHKVCNCRRGYLDFAYHSFQVPNVKLRPAQPSSSASTKRSNDRSHQSSSNSRNLVRHSSPDNEPENTFVDSCPRPFKGVVLCATGIQDKVGLFSHDPAHSTIGLTFPRRPCSRLRLNLVQNIART